MNAFTYLMMVLGLCSMLGTPAAADDGKAFIAEFNRALDQYASASGFDIAYDDIEHVSDPMIGSYYALINTKITIAGDMNYVVSATRIVLFPSEDNIYDINFPSSVEMTLKSEGQEEAYVIELGGRPKTQLRSGAFGNKFEIKVAEKDSPFTLKLSKALPKRIPNKPDPYANVRGVKGHVPIAAEKLGTNGWQNITPIPRGTLGTYIEKLCTAFNTEIQDLYQGYGFKGCVWFKK